MTASWRRTTTSAGGLAAEQMVKSWEAAGIDYAAGKVGIVNAMAGVQVLTDREAGFRDKLTELAPGVEILETRFVDNDMTRPLAPLRIWSPPTRT